MVFRNFRLNCTVRVVLLAATALLFAFVLAASQYFSAAGLALVFLAQTYALIRYVEITNRKLHLFFQSIEFNDLMQRLYPGPEGQSFTDLSRTLNDILDRFREMSTTREEYARYLDAVVQHIGIGVLAYDASGAIELLNNAAKALLDLPHLRNMDDLEPVHPALHARLKTLEPGRQALMTLSVHNELKQLSVHAVELRQRRGTLTLVSIQNISPELNEKEMEAWQNLIRVLTHEIKNSLTPIVSLAASVERMVCEEKKEGAHTVAPRDSRAKDALRIIQKRSRGLLQFVDAYRDLTHLPKPEYRIFEVGDLFSRVEKLVAQQIAEKGVRFRAQVRPDVMKLTADPELIEQVLINLTLNAIEATAKQEDAEITVEARCDERSRPVIEVSDNGPGIIPESLEKIFIPFYSTKKKGSGIGLSLSRQIMRLHRGDLTARSTPGEKTVFTMRF
jgi:signal transduction histidine kinase